MCLSKAKIQRRRDGTHTVCARPASAATVASATASGVVANGAGFRPAVIFVNTKPGRIVSTRTPLGGGGVAESLGQRVESGLGSAVDRV